MFHLWENVQKEGEIIHLPQGDVFKTWQSQKVRIENLQLRYGPKSDLSLVKIQHARRMPILSEAVQGNDNSSSSLAMYRMHEFHLTSVGDLSPRRHPRQWAILRVKPFIITGEMMLGNDEALLAWFSEVLDFVYFSPLSRQCKVQ